MLGSGMRTAALAMRGIAGARPGDASRPLEHETRGNADGEDMTSLGAMGQDRWRQGMTLTPMIPLYLNTESTGTGWQRDLTPRSLDVPGPASFCRASWAFPVPGRPKPRTAGFPQPLRRPGPLNSPGRGSDAWRLQHQPGSPAQLRTRFAGSAGGLPLPAPADASEPSSPVAQSPVGRFTLKCSSSFASSFPSARDVLEIETRASRPWPMRSPWNENQAPLFSTMSSPMRDR